MDSSVLQGVHWHCATISCDPEWLSARAGVLSAQEHARAARLKRPAARLAYGASHVALRLWLAVQLDVEPQDLRFVDGAGGKPELDPRQCAFNFSHSDAHWAAALQVGPDAQLGIDIESVARFAAASPELTRYMLAPAERAGWAAIAPGCRTHAMLLARVWTRKEALFKAIGSGLARPMNSVCVGWDDGPVSVDVPDLSGKAARWKICELDHLPQGLAGALASRIAPANIDGGIAAPARW